MVDDMDTVDELSTYYADLLQGSYDCIDRIVLNAYYTLCYSAGGFRTWWRQLMNGQEETLDTAHLMRLAGRFSRRVRAYAEAHAIPSSTAHEATANTRSRPRTWRHIRRCRGSS